MSIRPVFDDPRIAVVITCFNYARYVRGAIDSVLRQAVDGVEIVVVDDGSTDESWEVIARTGVPAYRIENGGQRAACLYGLERTTAPFVLFLDADDELKPNALETIVAALDPGVAKLQFALTCIDADGMVLRQRHPALEAFRDRDRLERQILRSAVYQTPPTSGNVFRRDVCELLRECAYDRAVDGVILFAAPFMGDVVSLPDDLGIYRIHDRNDSGLGRQPDAAIFERDLRRFLLRSDHLGSIVRRLRPEAKLVEPRDTYYYRMTQFYAAVCAGRRPGLGAFGKLLWSLVTEPFPLKAKLANAIFYLATYGAPFDRAKALLVYRLDVNRRSARSLLRAAVAG